MKKSEKVTSSYLQGITSSFDQVTSDARKWFDENKNEGSQGIFDIKCPFVGVDHSNTFDTNCISIPKGTSVKICNEDGEMMIIVEPKEVKHEFKKGDVMFLEVQGYDKVYQHIVIVKNADKDSIHIHVGLCINDNELTLPKSWFSNVDIKSIRFATEEEKRSLFLAMLNKGMFWDENKMKVRTLKDGDVITIKSDIGEYWQSIFKEIKDGKVYSYSDLDCDKKLYKGPFVEVNVILAIRYATTEERQTLFDKIEDQEHQKWNAETKSFEDFKWIAKNGQKYWYVSEYLKVESCLQHGSVMDTDLGEVNNKFKTKELAEAAADKIKELLSKL